MTLEFKGVFPAPPTPVTEDHQINEKALRALLEDNISHGCGGFWIAGSTGEGPILTEDQRDAAARISADVCKDRALVIMHVGSMSTASAVKAAKTAREAGDTTNPFWLFDVGEREPEVGDIVCRSRAGEGELELTYDNVHEHDPALPGGMRKSYCAVVVDVQPAENRIVVVGGNYSDSVGAQEHVLSNGHLRPADFFALIAIDTH